MSKESVGGSTLLQVFAFSVFCFYHFSKIFHNTNSSGEQGICVRKHFAPRLCPMWKQICCCCASPPRVSLIVFLLVVVFGTISTAGSGSFQSNLKQWQIMEPNCLNQFIKYGMREISFSLSRSGSYFQELIQFE